jgi:hypothetical protein
MLNIPNFNEIYNSYHNGHKFYTYDQLIKKYPDIENNAYMFINEDSYKNDFVIGKEYDNTNTDTNLWFTTKDVLETIKINNMKKMKLLYVAQIELCKNAYFNRSPKHIITTNKIIIREIKQVKVVKKFIVFD